jgi:hypothetical protein
MSRSFPTLPTLAEHLSVDEVDNALTAVGDLLVPERDLSVVDRDCLSSLIRVLCVLRSALAPV